MHVCLHTCMYAYIQTDILTHRDPRTLEYVRMPIQLHTIRESESKYLLNNNFELTREKLSSHTLLHAWRFKCYIYLYVCTYTHALTSSCLSVHTREWRNQATFSRWIRDGRLGNRSCACMDHVNVNWYLFRFGMAVSAIVPARAWIELTTSIETCFLNNQFNDHNLYYADE